MNIAGLNKAAVLAVLYNASRPLGMGFLQYDPKPMTIGEADEYLTQTEYFDYLKGRVMKVDLSEDELDTWGYNRDNGPEAAEQAIKILFLTDATNHPQIQKLHEDRKLDAAADAKTRLSVPSKFDDGVMTLGLADVADILGASIDSAIEGRTE